LVQYNDGFKTNLIGTPQQIAERIVALKNVGVDLVLSGFLHFIEEVIFWRKSSTVGSVNLNNNRKFNSQQNQLSFH
jgi:hypothetical protein